MEKILNNNWQWIVIGLFIIVAVIWWISYVKEKYTNKRKINPEFPNWSNLPDWVKYISQDKDGEWFGYAEKPQTDEESMWFTRGRFIALCCGKPNDNWQSTLQKKPEKVS